ncbi:30S ribosomal protein S4 [Candidatus Berkelbacteria bacterium]|nr:30S ribosomal protein S4 [Candidatus Berkelbacteria bacterium]MBI2588177.1 30S ribosomal protein S4 [Candidatus Berkelbacteria bacterium]MBI4029935.1 30S ribosomal protein S4 [Candidatus Berkelbacteria bacterium]
MARPKSSRPKGFLSQYGEQLRAKQLAKEIYGLRERQFSRFFKQASKSAQKGEKLLELLERRIDNAVYRLSWANSRPEARQLVSHGHIKLNDKKAKSPSLLVGIGDKIKVDKPEIIKKKMSEPTKGQKSSEDKREAPGWLKSVKSLFEAEVVKLPSREDAPAEIDENLIVEFYSR